MRPAFGLLALLVVATGCPNYVPMLPDGGRARVNCTESAPAATVKVLDPTGQPASYAFVNVQYLAYDVAEDLKTDGRGMTAIADKYGPGVVRVQGQLNDLLSEPAEITFIGGDCSSAVTPRSVLLRLQ